MLNPDIIQAFEDQIISHFNGKLDPAIFSKITNSKRFFFLKESNSHFPLETQEVKTEEEKRIFKQQLEENPCRVFSLGEFGNTLITETLRSITPSIFTGLAKSCIQPTTYYSWFLTLQDTFDQFQNNATIQKWSTDNWREAALEMRIQQLLQVQIANTIEMHKGIHQNLVSVYDTEQRKTEYSEFLTLAAKNIFEALSEPELRLFTLSDLEDKWNKIILEVFLKQTLVELYHTQTLGYHPEIFDAVQSTRIFNRWKNENPHTYKLLMETQLKNWENQTKEVDPLLSHQIEMAIHTKDLEEYENKKEELLNRKKSYIYNGQLLGTFQHTPYVLTGKCSSEDLEKIFPTMDPVPELDPKTYALHCLDASAQEIHASETCLPFKKTYLQDNKFKRHPKEKRTDEAIILEHLQSNLRPYKKIGNIETWVIQTLAHKEIHVQAILLRKTYLEIEGYENPLPAIWENFQGACSKNLIMAEVQSNDIEERTARTIQVNSILENLFPQGTGLSYCAIFFKLFMEGFPVYRVSANMLQAMQTVNVPDSVDLADLPNLKTGAFFFESNSIRIEDINITTIYIAPMEAQEILELGVANIASISLRRVPNTNALCCIAIGTNEENKTIKTYIEVGLTHKIEDTTPDKAGGNNHHSKEKTANITKDIIRKIFLLNLALENETLWEDEKPIESYQRYKSALIGKNITALQYTEASMDDNLNITPCKLEKLA
jgi:hypothetical protein